MEQSLKQIYYNPLNPGSFGGIKRLFDTAREIMPDITYKQVHDWLLEQSTYNLFKKSIKKFPRLPILVDSIDEQWQADLMDMTWLAKYNDKHRYLLAVIDCLSRYAWVEAVPDKSAQTIKTVFIKIMETAKRKPKKLQTDQGKEFVNSILKAHFKSLKINHFTSTDDVIKCAIVERFNRTLRTRIYRYMHYEQSRRYIDALVDIVDGYNRSFHRTIGMAPINVTKENEKEVIARIQRNQRRIKINYKPYEINQYVRITRAKGRFEKGATTNWTDELFKINWVKRTPQGYIYKLVDYYDEPITSIFYHPELINVINPRLHEIEKIIKERINPQTKKKEYFVKWSGYPDEFNSWTENVK